jgi:hypothetical protein
MIAPFVTYFAGKQNISQRIAICSLFHEVGLVASCSLNEILDSESFFRLTVEVGGRYTQRKASNERYHIKEVDGS